MLAERGLRVGLPKREREPGLAEKEVDLVGAPRIMRALAKGAKPKGAASESGKGGRNRQP